MKKMADQFEKLLNEVYRLSTIHLSALLQKNAGLKFVSDEDIENKEFGELLEYRNELTGNVFDFHPISIREDGQIEAYTIEGVPLEGDPVNLKRLPIDSRVELIRMIEEAV